MRKGIFLSVDGMDGSGKSTMIPIIAETFQQLGYEVVTTREPGGSPLAEKIRQLILNEEMDGLTEALLFAAARQDHIQNTIIPALIKGKVVITDRYSDSTYAYQFYGRDIHHAWTLEDMVVYEQNMVPDHTYFFTVDDAIADQRLKLRNGSQSDRFDDENKSFKAKVAEGYRARLKRVTEETNRSISTINANLSVEEVSKSLICDIITRFPIRKGLNINDYRIQQTHR